MSSDVPDASEVSEEPSPTVLPITSDLESPTVSESASEAGVVSPSEVIESTPIELMSSSLTDSEAPTILLSSSADISSDIPDASEVSEELSPNCFAHH